jgi:D-alanyl-D-alanine carboxypeptidase/D-alanyl-D-alanine-endopeptidase (penicillin-binding protein 4)
VGGGRRIGEALRAPGRGLRRAVAVLVVLAVTAATAVAVALTAPALVENLGLVEPQAVVTPPAPKPVLVPLELRAPPPTAAGLAEVLDPLADAPALGRFAGVVLDAAGGTTLWSRSPEEPLVPGSAAKLLTAAAALLTLDPAGRFATRAVAGDTPGTVVLVGGGDPTLTALPPGEEGVYPDPARLAELAEAVRRETAGPVRQVLVDTARYRGATLAPGWDPADVPAGFVAPIESLMLDGGRADPILQDGPRVGDPALAAGRALAELLGADPDTVAEGAAPAGAAALGEVASARMPALVEHMVRSSDNVLAEALAREVALVRGGEPSFAGAAEQTLAALDGAGFDTAGAELADASGLSTADAVPARLLGALLSAAAAPTADAVPAGNSGSGESPAGGSPGGASPGGGSPAGDLATSGPAAGAADTAALRPLLTGLPVAGGDGTLVDRFAADTPGAPGRGVVRAKTGTLTAVNSLAGTAVDADGRLLVFALMSNGSSPANVRPRLDAMAAALSGCGCR